MSSPFEPIVARPSPRVAAGLRRDDKVEIIMPRQMQQFADRRAEPREDAGNRGAVLVLANLDVVPCHILDQSPSGARVSFEAMASVPTELWLIDPVAHTAKRGTPAWSMPSRLGLKFNFIQALTPGAPRPPKVPQPVYDAWLKAAGIVAGPDQDDDVLYFD